MERQMTNRGGFVHNEVLLLPVESRLRELGARVFPEYHVAPGRRSGYVDLFAVWPRFTVCVEAEMSARRVWRDVEKATLLNADLLVILTPDCAVRDSCRKALGNISSISTIHETAVWILPLLPALQQLTAMADACGHVESP